MMVVDRDGDAEIYSPEGKCNYALLKTPIKSGDFDAVLFYYNNTIMACAPGQNCWKYYPVGDKWVPFSQALYYGLLQDGVFMKDKLYVYDLNGLQTLDLTSTTWSTIPKVDNLYRRAHTMFGSNDTLTLMGGDSTQTLVHSYNVNTKTWTPKKSAPFSVAWASTALTGDNEFLLAGSWYSTNKVAKYYPITDTWTLLPDSAFNLNAAKLLKLGSRFFAVSGWVENTVKEFSPATNKWTLINVNLTNTYNGFHSAIAVPASMFAHLPNGCTGLA